MKALVKALVRAGSLLSGLLFAHTVANLILLRRPPPAAAVAEAVSVLIPARNEAGRIGACLAAVLDSEHLEDLEVLVYDDDSEDATADVVSAIGGDRVRLCAQGSDAGAPPVGWLGKTWACARLAQAARGSVLVFLDADVVLAPAGLARTVAALREFDYGFISPYPRQLAHGLVGRLVQPMLQWSWLTFLPLRLAESARAPSSMAVANGQLLALDAQRYREVGGHLPVSGEVVEDLALARVLRRAGQRGGIIDGTAVATCDMYQTTGELIAGYTKSAWSAFGSPTRALGVAALLVLTYLVPAAAALRGSTAGRAGYALAVAGRVLSARRTGSPALPDALAHPLSVTAVLALLALSWRGRLAGSLRWKGRALP